MMALTFPVLALSACDQAPYKGFGLQKDCSISQVDFGVPAPVDEGKGLLSISLRKDADRTAEANGLPVLSWAEVYSCLSKQAQNLRSDDPDTVGEILSEWRTSEVSMSRLRTLARQNRAKLTKNSVGAVAVGNGQYSCGCKLHYPNSLGAST